MTNREMAQELRSAASALEHGRNGTARKKVSAVSAGLCIQPDGELVVVVEGGLVQDVKQIFFPSGRPMEPEHTIIDIDQLSQDCDDDVAERWGKFPEAVKRYVENYMPDEFAGFKAVLDRQRASAGGE